MRRWWSCIPLVIFGACSAFVVPSVFTAMDRSRQNRTIADIWCYSHNELEGVHDYIQWLFPLAEPVVVRAR